MTDINQKSLRFVTVLVDGKTAANEHMNVKRLSAVLDAAWQIAEAKWHSLDGLILPCGYFYYGQPIDRYGFETQKKLIQETMFHDFVIEALEILKLLSPYAHVITGIASNYPAGENLCVAWKRGGIASIGHEIVLRHGSGAKRLLWTYCNDLADVRPLMSFHSQSPAWLACYEAYREDKVGQPSLQKSTTEFKPVTVLPVTNHTGEAIVIRLFEAKF